MKLSIKNIIAPVVLAAAFSLVACDDWVDPESLDIKTPTFEQKDPALYKAYIEALREYKANPHKVVFLTVENPADGAMPTRRNEHLTSYPDSADYIVLNNPAKLHATTAAEIAEIHQKSIRTVYTIDFSSFETEWIQLLKTDATLTEEDALVYFTRRTNEELAYFDQGFDGIIFSYTGSALVGMTDEMLIPYTARQNSFLDPVLTWRAAHKQAAFSFMGNADFLVEANRAMLTDCDFLIVPTDTSTNPDNVTVRALAAISVEGVPSDRIVVTALSTRSGDDKKVFGYFSVLDEYGEQMRAVYGCAQWVVAPSSFTRAGLLIKDVQYDYFNAQLIYANTRQAIGIMNPSPKN